MAFLTTTNGKFYVTRERNNHQKDVFRADCDVQCYVQFCNSHPVVPGAAANE